MIIDSLLEFADSQDIGSLTAAGDADANASTNVLDLGAAGDAYDELYLHILIDGEAVAGTSSTVQFYLQASATTTFNATFATGAIWNSDAIAEATLVDGYKVATVRLPKPDVALRYLRLAYDVGTANLTAGMVSAFLSPSLDTNT